MRTHVGPHRAQLWLGSGGDAEVWAAEEALTGARIAVKLMKGEPSSGRVGRLVREYQYLRMLALEGVPRARGLGVDEDGMLFLVMDLVEGVAAGTWADRVAAEYKEDRALIVPRLQRMLVEAAGRLAAVHESGLVHGDVKPSCFLVGERDAVSLVDFGGSRPIAAQSLTRAIEEHFGTASYSAIECLHKAPPTVASDVWSFAATAFRMLSGEHPAGRGTRVELRARWEHILPPLLDERLALAVPELPAGARAVIAGSFAHEPAQRPSLEQWRTALAEGALGEVPSVDKRVRKVRHSSHSEPGRVELAARLVALLRIAGAPLSPRVLAAAAGRSTRRVLATLEAAEPQVRRAGTLSWTLDEGLAPIAGADRELANTLAEALIDEPIGAARVRALAAAGRGEETLVALERWVAALTAAGALAEALPVLQALPGSAARGFVASLALVRARAAVAGPSLDATLDVHLEQSGAADPLLAPALERARWVLARHFETFHVSSRPSSLAVGWRAYAMGELDAALASAETALEEARWLNQGDAEADALTLSASIHGARGQTSRACRLAAEAIDRWPARAPGIGAAVALHARLRLQLGAWSEARRLLAVRAAQAPTVIDRAHLLLVLAELELSLEHDAVADDALAAVEALLVQGAQASGPRPPSIEARLAGLRLAVPGRVSLAERVEEAERLLAGYVESGLALHAPMLASQLSEAMLALGDEPGARAAAAIAYDAARFMGDLPGELLARSASARIERAAGADSEVPPELLDAAMTAGLWPALTQLALARGDHATAWAYARRVLPNLDMADANALALMPWAVEAGA